MRKERAPWRTAIRIRQGACWLYLWEGGMQTTTCSGCKPVVVTGVNLYWSASWPI